MPLLVCTSEQLAWSTVPRQMALGFLIIQQKCQSSSRNCLGHAVCWGCMPAPHHTFCQGTAQRYSDSQRWHPSPAKGQTQCQGQFQEWEHHPLPNFSTSPLAETSAVCPMLTAWGSWGSDPCFQIKLSLRQRDSGSGPGPLFLAVWPGLVSLPC